MQTFFLEKGKKEQNYIEINYSNQLGLVIFIYKQ